MKVECIQARRQNLSIPVRIMIYANAVVDVIDAPPPHGHGLGKFRVEVWGKKPHDYVRVYEISTKDDNMAAREGLERFVEEISRLLEGEKGN